METGMGNANFYYALTLAYAIASTWLLSDVLSLSLRWDYTSKHNIFMDPEKNPKKEGTRAGAGAERAREK
jgi:hypothetical protein